MSVFSTTALALAAAAVLTLSPAHAKLKPGNYTVTIPNSCDIFELTFDADKVLVYGIHDLSACASPGTYVASGFTASINKTVIPPFTGSAWLVTSANDPNWIFTIDLVNQVIGVEEGTQTGETGYGPAPITYTYTKPGAAFAPARPNPGRPAFGQH